MIVISSQWRPNQTLLFAHFTLLHFNAKPATTTKANRATIVWLTTFLKQSLCASINTNRCLSLVLMRANRIRLNFCRSLQFGSIYSLDLTRRAVKKMVQERPCLPPLAATLWLYFGLPLVQPLPEEDRQSSPLPTLTRTRAERGSFGLFLIELWPTLVEARQQNNKRQVTK